MKNMNQYSLHDVTNEDCDLIFNWANDKKVRENSFHSGPIEYEEHQIWFSNQMSAIDSPFFIFNVGSKQVGLVRLKNIDVNCYQISYSISEENRGKGYATVLLKIIKDKYANNLLVGEVKPSNIASIKAFIKAGYIKKEESDIVLFYSSDQNYSTSEAR